MLKHSSFVSIIVLMLGLITACSSVRQPSISEVTLAVAPVNDTGALSVIGGDDFPTLTALQQANVPVNNPVDLARRLRGVADSPSTPILPPTRYVGDITGFYVTNSDEDYSFEVDARLEVIGETIYMWVEEGASVSIMDLQSLARVWDEQLYPQVRELWGTESSPGIDGDTRIHVLLTHDLGSIAAAHFLRRNTFSKSVSFGSNEKEMFIINLDTMANEVAGTRLQGVMAHEFQHMIRSHVDAGEATWLDEGFSTFTEFYLGYDDSSWLLRSFLNEEATQLNHFANDATRQPANYGASTLFVTYVYERYGLEALKMLGADAGTGLSSVYNVLQELDQPEGESFFAEWVLANWLQDTAMGDGRYGYSLLTLPYQPTLFDTVQLYPYTIQATAPQYSTHYYALTGLNEVDTLSVSLNIPTATTLIPASIADGGRVWYSNRGDNINTRLTRAFDLSGVETATLNYRAWYEIEANWDYAYVEISTDGGEHWEFLSTVHTTAENLFDAAYGPGYTGKSNGWINESITLDTYTGHEVLIRFELVTDDGINLPGLAIDDVAIPEIGYAAGFDRAGGEWLAEGWVLVDNLLPQQAWVQAIQYAGNQISLTRWRVADENSASTWRLPLVDGVDRVVLAVSPFAPVTTVPADYHLTITAEG